MLVADIRQQVRANADSRTADVVRRVLSWRLPKTLHLKSMSVSEWMKINHKLARLSLNRSRLLSKLYVAWENGAQIDDYDRSTRIEWMNQLNGIERKITNLKRRVEECRTKRL